MLAGLILERALWDNLLWLREPELAIEFEDRLADVAGPLTTVEEPGLRLGVAAGELFPYMPFGGCAPRGI